MNKLVTAVSTIMLCGFMTSTISTAEAASAKHSKHHTAKAHHRVANKSKRHHGHRSIISQHYVRHNNGIEGIASWYGSRFQGRRTANGEYYDMNAMTAAHNSLPLSSYAEVTNLKNHRSVIVRINDRGPFHGNRVMDLSYAAAKELDIARSGTASIKITPVVLGNPELMTSESQGFEHPG